MAQRKVWVVEVLNGTLWEMTTFGSMYWDTRDIMLEELASARAQYPDEKYKLTTYVPQEPARRRLNARVTQKKKTKRQRR